MPVSAWSIPKAKRGRLCSAGGFASSSNLGPGEYNPEKKQKRQPPQFSIPKARAQSAAHHVPGPGAYDQTEAERQSLHAKAPVFSIKGRHRDEHLQNTPGPIYDPVDPRLPVAPKYTMRPKTAGLARAETPAPTHYQPDYSLSKKKIIANVRFGHDQRRPLNDEKHTPGPGKYDLDFKEKAGPKYHLGLKTALPSGTMNNPGPGAYDKKTEFEVGLEKRRGTTLISRRPVSAGFVPPGPGAYEQNTQPIKAKAPVISIGKQQREHLTKEQLSKPGPGAYEVNPNLKGANEPRYKFGTSMRGSAFQNPNPGPGAYEFRQPIGKTAPKYHMGLKTQLRPGGEFVPGPGAYDPAIDKYSVKRAAPKVGMGTAKRSGLYAASETPGPGNYWNRPQSGKDAPKIGFGTQKRMTEGDEHLGPAPTSYDIKNMFDSGLEKKRGFSITQRRPLSAYSASNPGPGSYDPDIQPVRHHSPNQK